jgi:phosphoribosylamine--glycine ligase
MESRVASARPAPTVVIEECLVGRGGLLLRAVRRRDTRCRSAPAQDHKRVGDGDTGPNTGGMGAYSPPPVFTRGAAARR